MLFSRNSEVFYRIVGFEVEPQSIAMDSITTTAKGDKVECALSANDPKVFEIKKNGGCGLALNHTP